MVFGSHDHLHAVPSRLFHVSSAAAPLWTDNERYERFARRLSPASKPVSLHFCDAGELGKTMFDHVRSFLDV